MTLLRSRVKLTLMKKLSTYLFLILFSFSAPSFADDISDFQIEGISIGDSALEHFSEDKIKNNTMIDYYKDMKDFPFIAIEINEPTSLSTYTGIQFHVKKNDKKYKIYNINGFDFYDNDIQDCYKKQKEIDKKFSALFKDAKRRETKFKLSADKSGKSITKQIYYTFKSGDGAVIACYDWSDEITKTRNWTDNMEIALDKKEFKDAF